MVKMYSKLFFIFQNLGFNKNENKKQRTLKKVVHESMKLLFEYLNGG